LRARILISFPKSNAPEGGEKKKGSMTMVAQFRAFQRLHDEEKHLLQLLYGKFHRAFFKLHHIVEPLFLWPDWNLCDGLNASQYTVKTFSVTMQHTSDDGPIQSSQQKSKLCVTSRVFSPATRSPPRSLSLSSSLSTQQPFSSRSPSPPTGSISVSPPPYTAAVVAQEEVVRDVAVTGRVYQFSPTPTLPRNGGDACLSEEQIDVLSECVRVWVRSQGGANNTFLTKLSLTQCLLETRLPCAPTKSVHLVHTKLIVSLACRMDAIKK
jgi:hypothetical protein